MFSQRAWDRLPELIISNPIKEAEDKDKNETGTELSSTDRRVEWMVMLQAVLIVVGDSLIVQYLLQFALMIVSIGIVYGNATFWITFTVRQA